MLTLWGMMMSEIDKPVRKTYPTNRERDEEIEWLREELAECERVGGKFMDEIERLREEILNAHEEIARKHAQQQAQDAEIERLRAALVADDEGSTAYQSGWHARDAELEQLRGLLREWRDRGKHDRFYTTDFEKRVREALDE